MPGGLGLRVAVLAASLIAVAVVSVLAEWSTTTIILVMGAAWLIASAIELSASRVEARRRTGRSTEGATASVPETIPDRVRVLEPAGAEQVADSHEVVEEAEPEREPEAVPAGQVADSHEVAEPEFEPPRPPRAPEPVRPPLAAVAAPQPPEPPPGPPPEPEPEPEPVLAAAGNVVSLAERGERPREWNLWELERATRGAGGADPIRDEERNYLLMYLREFANANGELPADFDALVRDSFGDVIGALR